MPLNDVWNDIAPINSQAKERIGYVTQKPLALLERIIKASSNEGDVVLDPFCGCATTLEAAHKLKRCWIGIDIAIHAVKRVARVRLQDRLGLQEDRDFTIEGIPRNTEGARDLWQRDKYHFQKWAVEQVDGFVTTKRTADGGVDGRLYFDVPDNPTLQSMVIEVKGGRHVGIADVRALRGVLESGNTEIFRILDHVVGYCSWQCRVCICAARSPPGCFGCDHPVIPIEPDSSCWKHGEELPLPVSSEEYEAS